jgi:hypothetical protein
MTPAVNKMDCEFESEVLALVLESRWPEGVDAPLRDHVSNCAICSEVAEVARALQCEREELRAQAILPDSGRVWWLAQVRARREATEAAARPITVAQMLAFASAVGVLGACFGATSTWFQLAIRSIGLSLSGIDVRAILLSTTTLLASHAALAIGMAAVFLLVPAAIYFAISRE